MFKTADFDYPLPGELIAQHPAADRAAARMMVLDRATQSITHDTFANFPNYLRPGDLAVLNDTKVFPARLFSTDGRMELLLLEEIGPRTWKSLTKPGRRAKPGAVFEIGPAKVRVLEVLDDGERVIQFDREVDFEAVGTIPLPPYIEREKPEETDRERYQTVYAQSMGSVAAPTAGLHFTPEILAQVPHVRVTLHVGLGTFRPVKTERLEDHLMHREKYRIPAEAAARINAAGRVIAIGTTSVRSLESAAEQNAAGVWKVRTTAGWDVTRIFIHPPYTFKMTGALLTNFHLPRSTLLMLVSAFAGRDFIMQAYAQAVDARYRFFSYGDCMLIV
ncbi:MAG: tRNA preQ1(34) S-adenosylmethionine ribosyltransferase-isomerase QueA [Verrucomicrobiae bacterium]|nr:tRNA preQ1(34) S-adenosylmethionine ribosyltransferase-isomerase QueA [Verrucomicrobiae bacterium]